MTTYYQAIYWSIEMNKYVKKLYTMRYKWNILLRYNDKVKKYFIDTLKKDIYGNKTK